MPTPDPRAVYEARLAARQIDAARLDRKDRRLSQARAWVFGALVVAGVAAWRDAAPAWLAGVPALGFVVLVVVHARVARASERVERAIDHYREGLERLADRWSGRGPTGLDYAADDHPFAADLDLFGPGSLFDRLCRARTRAGEQTLAGWLADPFAGLEREADLIAIVRARQASVIALRERVELREDLALLGARVRAELRPASLIAWGRTPGLSSGLMRLWSLARVLAAPFATIATLTWALGGGPWLLVGHALALGLVHRVSKDALAGLAGPLDRSVHELDLLAALIERVEREAVGDPRLDTLREQLAGAAPAIARLRRLVGWYEAQHSSLFAPIAAMLAWAPGFGAAIERWRGEHGPRIAIWLAALGEWEALASLACYAFESPDDPFPVLVDPAAPCLHGDALAHPLLARAGAVPNSLALGEPARAQAYVISGSNMSGKSTFLRTVGSNVVLALAGAPVRARALELSPVRIGATLRIQDSLAAGRSRFWAELIRLRTITELAERGPLLFLLDEIFHGTNSHDRRIGAEALLRSLIERGAIGLLTTHDLALANAAAALAPRAINMHFQDELREGEGDLRFDYRMREGVVERSNALALMRAVGLRV